MLKEAVQTYARAELRVIIVWLPMLETDNEEAARRASAMFNDRRVDQFFDAQRLSGIAYSRDLFFPSLADALKNLPADRGLRERLEQARASTPDQIPTWDAAMFYPPGVEWKDTVPETNQWCKQLEYFGVRDEGITGTFWVDSLKEPPVGSDWFSEVRRHMRRLLAEKHDAAGEASTDGAEPDRPAITSLGESLDALRQRFNGAGGHHRFVALLSPT